MPGSCCRSPWSANIRSTGSVLEGGKLDAEMAFPWRIKKLLHQLARRLSSRLSMAAMSTSFREPAPGIVATFYFDKQTGLLTRMIRYANSAVGRVPTQIDYSDYRPVAGVMMPFKWTYGWVSGREEYTLTG